ncbi:MAG: hypothetical protein WB510_09745 [Candidatus Sulfotelmatobacter sp.]
MKHTRLTQGFIGLMVIAAAATAGSAIFESHKLHLLNAFTVLALAAVTSRMKIKLPGINGNMSVNLPFLLVAVVSLSALEAVAITAVSTVVQCWPRPDGKVRPEQLLFNVSMMAFAASVASLIWSIGRIGKGTGVSAPLMLILATVTFFLGQTAPVAGIIKLTEGVAMHRVWLSIAQLSFPYYVLSAGLVSMINVVSHHLGWRAALLSFPVMYSIHLSYRLYFGKAAEAAQASPPPRARTAAAGV